MLPHVLRNADSIGPPGLSHSPDFHPIPYSDPASPSRDIALEKLNISTRWMLLCPAQELAKSTSSCSWSHAWNHLSYQLGWSLKKDDAQCNPYKVSSQSFSKEYCNYRICTPWWQHRKALTCIWHIMTPFGLNMPKLTIHDPRIPKAQLCWKKVASL